MITVIHRKITFSDNVKPDNEEKKLIKENWELIETTYNRPWGIYRYKKIWEKEYGTIKEQEDL